MALAEYTDLFWFPSGELAIGVAVRIFPHDSNVLAPLFTDATGTVPLANPLTTSATGTIAFWAEAGLYWMHADSESFEIGVGLTPDDPDAIEELQAAVLQLQGEMNAVEGEVDTLQTDMNTAEADIDTLQSGLATANGEINALQADMNTAQNDINALQADVGAVEADIAVIQGDVTTLQADVTTAQADIAALQAQLPAIETLAGAGISTGITAGGALSVNALSPSAIDIAPFTGYLTDVTTDPFNPTITPVSYPGGTFELDAAALTRTVTWWLMDDTQTIIQQANTPGNAQRRTHLMLGVTAQEGGVIFVDQTLPVVLQQTQNQMSDLMMSLGGFSITGNTISPNGANLMINQTAGTLFARAFNHFIGITPTNNPHVTTTQAQTPAQFRYITQNALVFGPLRTTLDVANYDNAGVITPIGGGAGSSTIHRLWLFATNTAQAQLAFQYGQIVHSSLSAAVAAIGSGTFVVNPLIPTNGALIAFIVATRTATDLSNPAQATFVPAGKFASP